jgi:hypothetical protein
MERFLEKYQKQVTGVISVFDRIILKGYLPISYPDAAEKFFQRNGLLLKEFKTFTQAQTETLKKHALQLAAKAGRPYEYLRWHVRKEDYARSIAKRDGVTDGLICVLAINEENHSFALRYGTNRPHLTKCSPRCLTLYFYFLDRHFGFMHVRLSTWMPFSIQVYLNGHEWLAREMTAKGMSFEQNDNAFVHIADSQQAQRMADHLPKLGWEKILHVFARRVNPLLSTVLNGMEYYWVIDQAEYATDVMVGQSAWLDELYIKWQKHAVVCFQADDILAFMGRKLHGSFNSTIVTDVKVRPKVTRVKHVVHGNWIKMYNKQGIVLRVETVINRPQEFRVFRLGRGKKAGYYQPLRKRITNMIHFASICLRSNKAYLNALAAVDDPAITYRELNRICEPAKKGDHQYRPLNPLRDNDRTLFEAVIRGEHHLHGFKAGEIAKQLGIVPEKDPNVRKRQTAAMNRKLCLLRAHGLIARCGRARRYRVTEIGMRHMNAAILLHSDTLPKLLKLAA